jgi:uncharacterized delta-60 repeat protein
MRVHALLCLALSLLTGAARAQEGLPDPSFSGDGVMTFDDAGQEESGTGIAARPDGKIWVLGNRYDAGADTQHILLLRLLADGSPDNAFSGDGRSEISAGPGYSFGTCMVLRPDGSLLIGGYFIDELGYTSALVAKTDADGNLASGFGNGGIALSPTDGARITDLGVLSNGSMVATAAGSLEYEPAIYPLSAAGVFGTVQTYQLCSGHNRFNRLHVLPNDHVLVTGYHGYDSTASAYRVLVLALDPDLSGDTDFSPGYVCGQFNLLTEGIEYYHSGNPLALTNEAGNDVAILSNGDILVAGTSVDTANNADVFRTMLLKVHADNSVDQSFGNNGFIKSFVGSFYLRMVAQGNGNVLAVGGTSDGLCVLTRFNESGEQDLAFGSSGGSSLTDLGSFSTNPGGMAIQEDGRILVVGTAVNANNDLFVARFNGEPVGIGERTATAPLKLYPNPAAGRATLLCPPGARTLTVLDALGRPVVQQDVRGMVSASVEVAWPGVYQVEVRSAQGRSSARLVIH